MTTEIVFVSALVIVGITIIYFIKRSGKKNQNDLTNRGAMVATRTEGNIYATGNIFVGGTMKIYTASDKRLKTDIVNLENSLSIINKLRPITFNYNELGKSLTGVDTKQYGFIADELGEVLPNLIGKVYDKYKSINESQMISILVGAIKEQQVQIDKLTDIINTIN